MRMRIVRLGLAAVMLSTAPGIATAQRPDELGLGVGGVEWTRILSGESAGGVSPGLGPSALLTASVGWALDPHWGVRLDGIYVPTSLDNAGSPVDPAPGLGAFDPSDGVRLWSLTGAVHYAFVSPFATAPRWSPYVGGALGFLIVDPTATKEYAGSVPDEDRVNGVVFALSGRDWLLARELRPTGGVAVGVDVALQGNVGARAELGDRFFSAPVYPLVARGGALARAPDATRQGEVVHGIYLRVGATLRLGGGRQGAVARGPEPAPRPQPHPEPLPVREEPVRFCAVAPSSANGLETMEGLYRPSSQDTVIVVDGRRVPLHEALQSVPTATRAPWFDSGEPLVVRSGGAVTRFVRYQGPRRVSMGDLAHIGRVGGVPAFADRREVSEDAWRRALQPDPTANLEDLLVLSDLRGDFSKVTVLYLPLNAAGCIFQPFVRSGAGGDGPDP